MASYHEGLSQDILIFQDTEIEELFIKMVGMGTYQWLLLVFLMLSVIPFYMSQYLTVFFCPPGMSYWCKPPEDVPKNEMDSWILATHPYKWYTWDNIDSCQYYNINYTDLIAGNFSLDPTDLQTCTEFVFSNEDHGVTLYEQFDLGCENELYVQIFTVIFDCGLMIGHILFGYLADRFGRKISLFLSLGLQPLVGLCVAFSYDFTAFVVLQFVYGLVVSGEVVVAHILLLEIVGNRRRSLMAGLFVFSACIGFMTLPLLNWLVKDWQKLQMIVSVPTIFLLVFIGFVPESPVWLLTKNRPKKAIGVMLHAAFVNRTPLKSSFQIRTVSNPTANPMSQDSTHETMCNILSHLNIVKAAIALFVLNFFIGLMIRLLILVVCTSVIKEMFVAFVIFGAMGFLAVLLGMVLVQQFKHHKSLVFSILLCVFSTAIATFFPLMSHTGLDQPKVILLCIALLFAVSAFYELDTYGGRAYPTVFRGTLFGCTKSCYRLGALCAPFLVSNNDTDQMIVMLIVCALMCLMCLLPLWLPTVHHRELPDTLQDAHNFCAMVKPLRWTNMKRRPTEEEEHQIQAFDMDKNEQPQGLDFSLNRIPNFKNHLVV